MTVSDHLKKNTGMVPVFFFKLVFDPRRRGLLPIAFGFDLKDNSMMNEAIHSGNGHH
jgi:hypothetical protein